MTRNLERRSKRKFQRMECNKIYDKRMIKIQNYRIKLLSVTIELSFIYCRKKVTFFDRNFLIFFNCLDFFLI